VRLLLLTDLELAIVESIVGIHDATGDGFDNDPVGRQGLRRVLRKVETAQAAPELTPFEWRVLDAAIAYYETVLDDEVIDGRPGATRRVQALSSGSAKLSRLRPKS